MVLNRLNEAEVAYQQAEEHKLEGEALLANRYYLAFLKGDSAQMAKGSIAKLVRRTQERLSVLPETLY
jgi:hypothetical protein